MATIRQVEDELKAIVVGAIYPTGTSNPSIVGTLVKIRNGWPISAILDADVLAGNSQVSIFPVGMTDKNVTKFTRIWQESSRNLATLFTTVLNNQITITGTVTVPQAILVTLNKIDYGYSVQSTDTLDTIASSIATLIPGATALANVITITGVIQSLLAVVVVTGTLALEIKRQIKLFYVSVFSPTPDIRETLGDAIETALGSSIYLQFSDGTSAPIFYKGTNEQDMHEKNIIYQRDLVWTIEYPSMIYSTGTEIQSIYANVN